jgi:tetratricopeptide (TPR) repeat protein
MIRAAKLIAWSMIAGLAIGGCSRKNDPDNRPVAREPDPILDNQDPTFTPAAHLAAGQLAESQGRAAVAAGQYRAGLALDSNHAELLFSLARVETVARNYDQAIAAWERYVQVTHESPTAWSNLARCHELAGHWTEAEVSYLRALVRDPNHEQTRVNYGILLAKRDRVDEAEQQLAAVLPLAAVHYNLASVYELKGNKPAAREEYHRAIELDPKFVEARQRLALMGD